MNILFSITQLKYILEVDRLKSFGLAAKTCNVSQPTLSMQVQKLEEDYDIQIFKRNNRRVETTEKGKEIINLARDIVAQAEFTDSKLRNEPLSVEGEFRLGIIPTVSPFLLPLFLESFHKKYPKTKLIVQEIQTSFMIESLQQEKLDLGILATPLSIKNIVEYPLFYEEFMVYLQPTSELLKKDILDRKDLNESNILLLEDGHCFKEQALDICNVATVKQAYPIRAGSIQTLTHLVDTNLGFTFVPELSVQYLSGTQKKQVRSLKQSPYREISLITTKSFRRLALLKIITEEIITHLPKNIETTRPKNVLSL
jgi:LysR family hydrogen peroxide-inducible transcriptional activator